MSRAWLPFTVRLTAVALLAAVAGSATRPAVAGAARSAARASAASAASRAIGPSAEPHQAEPIPFDTFPAVPLPTTDGTVTLGGGGGGESGILLVHSNVSVLGEQLWGGDVSNLFELSPEDDVGGAAVHYVFAPYADTPEAVAAGLAPL